MSQTISIEVSDDRYARLQGVAAGSNQTVEEFLYERICAYAPSPEELDAAMESLLKHAGTAEVSETCNTHNEAIDADLAREYASTHEPTEPNVQPNGDQGDVMSNHRLQIEVSPELYDSLRRGAHLWNVTIEKYAVDRIEMTYTTSTHTDHLTDEQIAESRARLMQYAGCVSIPDPTNADNEAIDADLAREYAATHEDQE